MNYLRLFISNRKFLLFAIILTFYSGFGQTFLLSLYIPSIIKEFNLNPSVFSSIYAAATLCSGLLIIFAGKLIDRMRLISFTLLVILGITAANVIAGFSANLVMIFIAFFMLRFFGQGLLTHTAMTAMGRYFTHARGKALSIAYLGFPMSEALFPLTIVLVIAAVGWRETFLMSAGFILITLLPLTWLLIGRFDKTQVREGAPQNAPAHNPEKQEITKEWSQKQILKNINFYIFAPTVFIVGFTLTAAFYFQTFIADFKGWSVEWMALSIAAYAISSLTFSILTGTLIDKFSARRIFPFILLPMAIGLIVIAMFQHPYTAVFFWFLMGISAGANPTTGNALYAETYGVKNLGSIRSIFTFVMVSSTAAGPILFSLLIEIGLNFNMIHAIIAAIILINAFYIGWGLKRSARTL
jgi:MFS family permease